MAWRRNRDRKKRRLSSLKMRPRVFAAAEAQGWRCCWCGVRMVRDVSDAEETRALVPTTGKPSQRKDAIRMREVTAEHIVPRCDGGWDSPANLAAACRFCNHFRSNQPIEKAQRHIDKMLRKGTHPHQAWDERGQFFGQAHMPSIDKMPVRKPEPCRIEVVF